MNVRYSFYHEKIFLIESECKTPIGCLTFIFYQKYFYDKMDLRLFYVRVTYGLLTEHITSNILKAVFHKFRMVFS